MAENVRKAISDVLEEAKIYSCDKWKLFIVSDMLGSVFYFGDVFGSVFDVGHVLGSASDVNKPTVCNLVMLMKCNLF